jgi:16S rRNA (cytosine967-C5)-methyltransferase
VPSASVSPARAAALAIASDLRAGDLLDASFDRRAERLELRDRRWLQELVWGMLRRRTWIDAVVAARVHGGLSALTPSVVDAMRLGTYQLLCMGSVPVYAAIAQTVEQVKALEGVGAARLANAVLRRIDREREQLEPAHAPDLTTELALRFSHPEWIVARWLARFGEVDTRALLAANNAEAPIVVRPYNVAPHALGAMLDGAGVHTEAAPLVDGSLRLARGTALTALDAFQDGRVFVQDPAATLVTDYAAIPLHATVADLCAAPGGKTLELAKRARVVVAADRHSARLDRMLVNFGRLDVPNVVTVRADAAHPACANMDAVLVDAPCTGTGTFRRHPDARWRLKMSDLAVMRATQRALLSAASAAVRPGGLLIYSTCSLEPEENDDPVTWLLERHPEFTLEPPPPGSVPAEVIDRGTLRVLPQHSGTDGAFAARFRRAA